MKEAAFWDKLDGGAVRCTLCPHHCRIPSGRRGICLTRSNIDGTLVSLNYCRPVSTAIDPIEKKPLYHFFPGSSILSTGPNGCTFKCVFCQNCEISQSLVSARELPAESIADSIIHSGTIGVAYTYSEPYIWYETIMEVGARVRDAGLVNVMVTNGFMEPAPLDNLLSVVDAMNIDIKSMDPAFYRRQCAARLDPVLRTCETARKRCHVEITNLLVTGLNDREEDVRELARWVAGHLGRDTPLHLSRYFPRHRMRAEATAVDTMRSAYAVARAELDFVYVGNVSSTEGNDTRCAACGATIVRRAGYSVEVAAAGRTRAGAHEYLNCPSCGAASGIRAG